MRQKVILDTGPLVAFINRREHFHDWVMNELLTIEQPLLTCEAVVVEACFLLRAVYDGVAGVMSLINEEMIHIPFRLNSEATAVEELLKRYQSVPMSLADACLVRMSELYPSSELLTLDSDFQIYRKNRNQEIPIIMPKNI